MTDEISQPYARELARQVDELEKENAELRAKLESAMRALNWIVSNPNAHPTNMVLVASRWSN